MGKVQIGVGTNWDSLGQIGILENAIPSTDNLSQKESAHTGWKRPLGQLGQKGQEYVYQKILL